MGRRPERSGRDAVSPRRFNGITAPSPCVCGTVLPFCSRFEDARGTLPLYRGSHPSVRSMGRYAAGWKTVLRHTMPHRAARFQDFENPGKTVAFLPKFFYNERRKEEAVPPFLHLRPAFSCHSSPDGRGLRRREPGPSRQPASVSGILVLFVSQMQGVVSATGGGLDAAAGFAANHKQFGGIFWIWKIFASVFSTIPSLPS